MFILVEGPDGAGKTTFAKERAEIMELPYYHFSYPKNEAEAAALFDTYLEFIQTHKDCIVDRMFPSTMIYGNILRNEAELSQAQHDRLLMELQTRNATVFYCTGPIGILWKRCQDRGEDYITSFEVYEDIYTEYESYMNCLAEIYPSLVVKADLTKREFTA